MRASTERRFVEGPAGRIECAVDRPDSGSKGAALIAHPHPQFGGTLDNKVVQTLARAFVELGYESWRPNFRGIGQSDGRYDEGRGEVEDLAAVFSQFSTKSVVLAPADTLVIHGERDDTVPLAAVLDWARPQELPIVLVPGADHFFNRRLHSLRAIVEARFCPNLK